MFTFQAPPYFFHNDLDISDAQVSQFTPIYYSKRFSAIRDSEQNPLHYENRVVLEAGDIVLHLVAEQGRVVRVEIARVWDTLYYEDGSPIGAVLVSPEEDQLNNYYIFTKIDATGEEKSYFCNCNTLDQKQIHRHTELLSRKHTEGKIWLPEKDSIQPSQLNNTTPYPNQVSDEYLHHAVVHYARQGNPACLFAAAFWFREQGKTQQAIHGLQKAAEKHFPFAWLELGFEYHEDGILGSHPDKAVTCFRQAAYGGLPLANYQLALAHIDGIGTEQSDTLALSHMQKAKDGGILAANLALALYYRNGSFNHLRPPSSPYRTLTPHEVDYNQAAQLFFQAASAPWYNAPIAAYYLAECYRTGSGVLMDKEYARELYRQAATTGSLLHEEIQTAAYYNGDVERLTQLADDYPFAAYLVGRMYWFGEFAPKNYEIAKRYLKIAANSGHSCAEDASQLLQNSRDHWRI